MVINFYAITGFVNFITGIVMAILVVSKNRKNPKNVSFFILAILVAFWSICYGFWQMTTVNEQLALFWTRALMVFTIMIPAAYFHFSLAITDELEKRKKTMIAVYLFFYLFMLSDATPFFIRKVGPVMEFKFWPMATPIMSAWLLSFGICIAYSAFLLIRKYYFSSGITKLQLKYICIGTIISFICGTLNFVPWYKIPFPPIANALVPFYVIPMAYAITRYRLMDIKTLTKNITFYFIIAVIAYGSFYGLAFFYKFVFGDAVAKEGFVLGLVIAPLFSIVIYNSGKNLSRFLNKHIFYTFFLYEQNAKNLELKLRGEFDAAKISKEVVYAVKTAFEAGKVSVFAVDGKKKYLKNVEDDLAFDYNLFSDYFKEQEILTREELDDIIKGESDFNKKRRLHEIETLIYKNEISICSPLKNKDGLIGLIIIKTKPYEGLYSKESFEFLDKISNIAEIALANSLAITPRYL